MNIGWRTRDGTQEILVKATTCDAWHGGVLRRAQLKRGAFHYFWIRCGYKYKVSALKHNAKSARFRDHRTMEGPVEADWLFGREFCPKLIPDAQARTGNRTDG